MSDQATPESVSSPPPLDHSLASTSSLDARATASHPPPQKPDPTTAPSAITASPASTKQHHGSSSSQGPVASSTSAAAKLSGLKAQLTAAIHQYPDFPSPGILFEDIFPIFRDAQLHEAFISALELQIATCFGESIKLDVVVGLEARGFTFGPSLALRLGAAFVPVRKKGKLPGETVTASYEKEYGQDLFEMQCDSINPGQKVVIVDDLVATGKLFDDDDQILEFLGTQT